MFLTRAMCKRFEVASNSIPKVFMDELCLAKSKRDGSFDIFGSNFLAEFDRLSMHLLFDYVHPDVHKELKSLLKKTGKRILVIDLQDEEVSLVDYKSVSKAFTSNADYRSLKKECESKKHLLVIARLKDDYRLIHESQWIGFAYDHSGDSRDEPHPD